MLPADDLVDTLPDPFLDRIAAMAARRVRAPIALVALVDAGRIGFKAGFGIELQQAPLGPCASTIVAGEPSGWAAAVRDRLVHAVPWAGDRVGLPFYAGVMLRTPDGRDLGALCVLDRVARAALDGDQLTDLQDLAALATGYIERCRTARRAEWESGRVARESGHRVMNSLQFITTMLNMQARAADDFDLRAQLETAAGRVTAVARVHRSLYLDPSGRGTLDYVRRLCADLGAILQVPVHAGGIDAALPSRQLQPIGLLLNELVTSAAKRGSAEIHVQFGPADDALALQVRGVGADPSEEPVEDALGLRLVAALARQLRGRVASTTDADGVTIVFPALPPGA